MHAVQHIQPKLDVSHVINKYKVDLKGHVKWLCVCVNIHHNLITWPKFNYHAITITYLVIFLLVISLKTKLMLKNNRTMITFAVFFSHFNMNPHDIECHSKRSPLWIQIQILVTWIHHFDRHKASWFESFVGCASHIATLLIILLMWPHLNLLLFCIVQHHLILFISRNVLPPHANRPTHPPIHHSLAAFNYVRDENQNVGKT